MVFLGLLFLVVTAFAHDGNCNSSPLGLPAGADVVIEYGRRNLPANQMYTNPLPNQGFGNVRSNLPNQGFGNFPSNLPNQDFGNLPSTNLPSQSLPSPILTSQSLPSPIRSSQSLPGPIMTSPILTSQSLPNPILSSSSLPSSLPIDTSNLGFSSSDIPINQALPNSFGPGMTRAESPVSGSEGGLSTPITGQQPAGEVQQTQNEEQQIDVPEQTQETQQVQQPIPEPVEQQQQQVQEEPQVPDTQVQESQTDIREVKGGQRFLTSASNIRSTFPMPTLTRSFAATRLNLPSAADHITDGAITISFSCENRPYGYYADIDNNCQIYHICRPITLPGEPTTMHRFSFVCPINTIFDQVLHVCVNKDSENLTPCHYASRYYPMTAQRFAPPLSFMTPSSSSSFSTFTRAATKGGPIVQQPAPVQTFFRDEQQVVQTPLPPTKGIQQPVVQPPVVQQPVPVQTTFFRDEQQVVQTPLPPTKGIQQPVVQQPAPAPTTFRDEGIKGVQQPVEAPAPTPVQTYRAKGQRIIRAAGGVKGYRADPPPKGYRAVRVLPTKTIAPPPTPIPARKTVKSTFRADPVKNTRLYTGTLTNYNLGPMVGPMVAPISQPLNFVQPALNQNFVQPTLNQFGQPVQPLTTTFVQPVSNLPLSPAMRLGVRKN